MNVGMNTAGCYAQPTNGRDLQASSARCQIELNTADALHQPTPKTLRNALNLNGWVVNNTLFTDHFAF
jgi:hypothetical protein